MTTYQLGLPAELKRRLEYLLPRQRGIYPAHVRVVPRDRMERKCPAWDADHYEVQAFYTTTDTESLDQLQEAIAGFEGVYITTQVLSERGRNTVTNSEWPALAGTARRGFDSLRPQVLALLQDVTP